MTDEHLISTIPGVEPRAPFRDRTYTASEVRAMFEDLREQIITSEGERHASISVESINRNFMDAKTNL